jgi:hypothetical protein
MFARFTAFSFASLGRLSYYLGGGGVSLVTPKVAVA